jgi:hypothetical protein
MSFKTAALAFVYLSVVLALPVPREVPQGIFSNISLLKNFLADLAMIEHSHEPFLTSVRKSLNLNNPDGISDPVFGLLGNAAAAGGAGKIAVRIKRIPLFRNTRTHSYLTLGRDMPPASNRRSSFHEFQGGRRRPRSSRRLDLPCFGTQFWSGWSSDGPMH